MATRTWSLVLLALTAHRAPAAPSQRANRAGVKPPPVARWDAATLAKLLPPGHPPCFSAVTWQDYVLHAANSTRHSHIDGPLHVSRGKKAELNPGFDYCRDCLKEREVQMTRVGHCDKVWLVRLGKPARRT